MNKILILGYSDISQRRIIPALNKLDEISSIEIATKSKEVEALGKIEKTYKSYEKAIESTDANFVYISLPNSLHFDYGKQSLLWDKNIIIDKPAVLNKSEFEELTNLAKKNNLFISQSCVFQHHKAWVDFKKYSKKYNKGVLTATFLIPELHSRNFRMSNKLGGGSVNDMGIYASESGRNFWENSAKSFSINDVSKPNNKVNMGFTGKASYGEGKEAIFEFGFNREYKNNITFLSNEFLISYERVFSAPEDFKTCLTIKNGDEEKNIEIGFDDTFNNYLKDVYVKYKNNDIDTINREFEDSTMEFLKLKKELK